MTDNINQSPDAIERDIKRTQAEMSATVDQLGGQMTPRNIFNALLDKADENDVDARMVIEGARRNPVALALIAAGSIWLISDRDAKIPGGKSSDDDSSSDDSSDSRFGWNSRDDHHRGYVSHMASINPERNEDDIAYRRRRDHARASYLMIEQKHDEDDKSFRDRLDEATESMREKRDQWADKAREQHHNLAERAGDWADSAREQGDNLAGRAGDMGRGARGYARSASAKSRSLFFDNPLLGGLIAATVGAVAGTAIPITDMEEEKMGGLGEQALDMAEDKASEAADMAKKEKDKVVDAARGEKDKIVDAARGEKDKLVGQAEKKMDASNPGSTFT